jgi:hypothetical protein
MTVRVIQLKKNGVQRVALATRSAPALVDVIPMG